MAAARIGLVGLLAIASVAACAAGSGGARPQVIEASATAYCQRGITRSGEPTRPGIVAADPRVLPLGSVVRIDAPDDDHDGVYTVLDTGAAVKGRIVDIFMPDCRAARQFGRRPVLVHVLTRPRDGDADARKTTR